jgi:hypothetical protein
MRRLLRKLESHPTNPSWEQSVPTSQFLADWKNPSLELIAQLVDFGMLVMVGKYLQCALRSWDLTCCAK